METKRRKTLMVRWSFLTAGLIAVFWTGWYFVTSEVPVATSFMTKSYGSVALPLALSRWWDILIGPIGSCLMICLCTHPAMLVRSVFRGAFRGFAIGVGVGISFGLTQGLVVGIIVIPVFGLAYALLLDALWSLAFEGLISSGVVSLAIGLQTICSFIHRSLIGRYLAGKDKQ